jgi:hypothetical protein
MNAMKRTLFVCRCYSIEHSFIISADDEDVFIEVHLSPAPFLGRVKNAIRYVFGKKTKWGDFEEILLSPSQALDLGDKLIEWAQGESSVFQPNDVF